MVTVKELIEQLNQFDLDVEVAISYDGLSVDEIDHIDSDEDDRAIIRPVGYENWYLGEAMNENKRRNTKYGMALRRWNTWMAEKVLKLSALLQKNKWWWNYILQKKKREVRI